MGFEVNPYDPCVANKMVNGHQMTIRWHVDDLKVSHKDEGAVTALALKLASLYGEMTTISRAKIHEYLGMDIDWLTDPGTMMISMIKYLKKVIWTLGPPGLLLQVITYLKSERMQIVNCSLRNKLNSSTVRWPNYYSYVSGPVQMLNR